MSEVRPESSAVPQAEQAEDRVEGVITWDARMSILTNRFMWWDMVRVTVLSALIMWLMVLVMGLLFEGEAVVLPPAFVALTAGILIVLFVIASLVLGNHINLWFGVGPEGVAWASGKREQRINRGTAIIGLLAGSASTAGAGLLATAIVEEGVVRGAAERALLPPKVRRPRWQYAAWVLVPVIAAILVTAWSDSVYEDGIRLIAVSAVAIAVAGLIGGLFRRVAAGIGLLTTGYVSALVIGLGLWPWPSSCRRISSCTAGSTTREASRSPLRVWRSFSASVCGGFLARE